MLPVNCMACYWIFSGHSHLHRNWIIKKSKTPLWRCKLHSGGSSLKLAGFITIIFRASQSKCWELHCKKGQKWCVLHFYKEHKGFWYSLRCFCLQLFPSDSKTTSESEGKICTSVLAFVCNMILIPATLLLFLFRKRSNSVTASKRGGKLLQLQKKKKKCLF